MSRTFGTRRSIGIGATLLAAGFTASLVAQVPRLPLPPPSPVSSERAEVPDWERSEIRRTSNEVTTDSEFDVSPPPVPLPDARAPRPIPVLETPPAPEFEVETAPDTKPTPEARVDRALRNLRPATPRRPTAMTLPVKHQPAPYNGTIGERTTSVVVDWITPESILVGDEGDYDLVVLNRGRIAVQNVRVHDVVPAGFRLVDAKPAPVVRDGRRYWRIDEIPPSDEVRIRLRMVAVTPGTSTTDARVEFETSSTASFRVVEPKLALVAEAPENVLVGDKAIFHLTVKNDGTGKTTGAEVRVVLPADLYGKEFEKKYEVGDLNPGESRSVQVAVATFKRGEGEVKFLATADRGLSDADRKSVEIVGAELAVDVVGPKFRYVSRPATYKVRVRNVGTARAEQVKLRTAVPEAFAFVSGGKDGRFDSRSKYVNWTPGTLEPGGEFVCEFTLRAEKQGKLPIHATAIASRGLDAEAQHVTRVDGIDAILLEVVDVNDPIEVGADTMYEVLVRNQGTEFATNVRVAVELPEGMVLTGQKGPTAGAMAEGHLHFAPIAKLAPRADAVYRISVQGTKPGDQRVAVYATADSLASPVVEVESTKVYRDE